MWLCAVTCSEQDWDNYTEPSLNAVPRWIQRKFYLLKDCQVIYVISMYFYLHISHEIVTIFHNENNFS